MTSLLAGDFGEEELNQILNTQLDSLAISPQAKQNIIPGLIGIAKLAARVQLQGYVYAAPLPMFDPQFLPMYKCTHIAITIYST